PIRFDLLDTMDGGNLSFQVHPTEAYIKEKFGMAYTQDESYYLLDAKPGAMVYLGLKTGIDTREMIADLRRAKETGCAFAADKYVNAFPARKHDHFLIPNGTVHCSGANSMVLEISATPYIFTFKMYDWGRLGLDGQPRAINIDHAVNVIDDNRDTQFCLSELVNQVELLAEGDGWREERTGLHRTEVTEAGRHWFTKSVTHHTGSSVNVLNLVQGREAIVESPVDAFNPFIVHYAETFIVPARVGTYTIRPYGESEGAECATLKAYVRTDQ
ncbi:MAG TPA: class I mannose-6-phosphate isomerase, partial [Bacteroidales bacterium]|nr:class I mannose-6-phosphate isomerase [Bacteroidales bacterium]